MSAIVALLLAFIKAIPAAERVADEFWQVYTTIKLARNRNETASKDSRDDAAVDALAAELPKLCAECPFAGIAGRQHSTVADASAVPGSRSGGS